jgi:kynurenine formamidase
MIELEKYQIIDLTQPISSSMTTWPGDPQTEIEPIAVINDHGYFLNRLAIGEHTGTHIGAPLHIISGGRDVSDIEPNYLITPAVKITISPLACENPDYLLRYEDIIGWENIHGTITKGSVVLVETGWSKFWTSPNEYFGYNGDTMHFPGISSKAAKFLVETRRAVGLGIDSAGLDGGQCEDLLVNRIFLKAGAFHLENLTHLDVIPETGAIIFIGALPIIGGSGSPCRVLLLKPE